MAVVAASPSWIGVLALTTVITFLGSAALLQTEIGRQALVDQLERTALAFGRTVDDVQYARFQEMSEQGFAYAAITALAGGPLLTIAVAFGLAPMAGGAGTLRLQRTLAVSAHAGVALGLRQVVAVPLDYVRETLASPTTLVQFIPSLDEASPVARFFGIVDLFVLWWIVLLAIGVSTLSGRPARPLVLRFLGIYVALALLLALVMALTGGTA